MRKPKTPNRRCLKRVVSHKSLVHGIADCTDCEWGCQDYLTVQAQARKHASETGHEVSMELGYHVALVANKLL